MPTSFSLSSYPVLTQPQAQIALSGALHSGQTPTWLDNLFPLNIIVWYGHRELYNVKLQVQNGYVCVLLSTFSQFLRADIHSTCECVNTGVEFAVVHYRTHIMFFGP